MDIQDYLTNPSAFTKELSFEDHGKERHIVTYYNREGAFLRKKHLELLEELSSLPSSSNSYAYKKGVRLLDALLPHLGNITFLKLDIKHFFDSIDKEILLKKINDNSLLRDNFEYCFYNNKLPIGFVTSPRLSDFYLYEFDVEVQRYCIDHHLVYSRYADDFLVSSSNEDFAELDAFKEYIKEKLKDYKLEINEEKTIEANLHKQTSIRFLGLNIGEDKITISKWYILKTLNAFKRYRLAIYNKADNVNELKSIAYGLYNFIAINSEASRKRFVKKYFNLFGEAFETEIRNEVVDGVVTYTFNPKNRTYRAVISDKNIPSDNPFFADLHGEKTTIESVTIKDAIDGYKVTSLKNDCSSNSFYQQLKSFKLSSNLVSIHIPFNNLTKLDHNPILDIVDVKKLKPKKQLGRYVMADEIVLFTPYFDGKDTMGTFYKVKRTNDGYLAQVVKKGAWNVASEDHFEEVDTRIVSCLINIDNVFDYFVEQVLSNEVEHQYGRHAYIVDGDKHIKSPFVTIEMLACMQYFFKKIINFETNLLFKNEKSKYALKANTYHVDKNEEQKDIYTFSSTIDKYTSELDIDFIASSNTRFASSYKLHKEISTVEYRDESSCWLMEQEGRAKELLVNELKNMKEDDSGFFKFTYQNKHYSTDKLKTSIYHLLQFLSPKDFIIPEEYLVDDGVGEYLAIMAREREVPSRAYMNNETLKVVRVSDRVTLGSEVFKNASKLERFYVSREFYAYRRDLSGGVGILEGTNDVKCSYFPCGEAFIIDNDKPINIRTVNFLIEREEDLREITYNCDKYMHAHVRCYQEFVERVTEMLESLPKVVSFDIEIIKPDEDPGPRDLPDEDDDFPF